MSNVSRAVSTPAPVERVYSIARARIHPSSKANAAPDPKAPESGWLASPMRTTFPCQAINFSSRGPAKAENSFQLPIGTFARASRTRGSKSCFVIQHFCPHFSLHYIQIGEKALGAKALTVKCDSTLSFVAGTPQLNLFLRSVCRSITFLAAISNICPDGLFSLGSSTREK